MALLLNSVLGVQLWMYWGNWEPKIGDEVELGDMEGGKALKAARVKVTGTGYKPAAWEAAVGGSPTIRFAPVPQYPAPGVRTWGRKAD